MDARKLKKARQIIVDNPHISWYVKDISSISAKSVVEHIINYGTWDDFKNLINTLGMEYTAKIFYDSANNLRSNYKDNFKHFFNIYFKKNA